MRAPVKWVAVAALVVTPAVIGAPALASAGDDTGEEVAAGPLVIADTVVEPGESATIELDAVEIAESREADAALPQTATEAAAVEDLLEESPGYTAQDIEAFVVTDTDAEPASADADVAEGFGDVVVAVPTTVEVTSIEVDVEPAADGTFAVSVDTTAEGVVEEVPLPSGSAGPGMAPWLKTVDVGNYTVKFNGIGNLFSVYRRQKVMEDGLPNKNIFAATKDGVARPADISGGFDARVTKARIQTWPTDATRSTASLWLEKDPGVGFTKCQESSIVTNVMTMGGLLGISWTPKNCEDYDVWFNSESAGSYRMSLDQGLNIGSGDRELGYAIEWQTPDEVGGEQVNRTSVTFRLEGESHTCTSDDTAPDVVKGCAWD
jgi:hypothetical protein